MLAFKTEPGSRSGSSLRGARQKPRGSTHTSKRSKASKSFCRKERLGAWRLLTRSWVIRGEFDDQLDAMTQYLDFMDSKPTIKPAPRRGIVGRPTIRYRSR